MTDAELTDAELELLIELDEEVVAAREAMEAATRRVVKAAKGLKRRPDGKFYGPQREKDARTAALKDFTAAKKKLDMARANAVPKEVMDATEQKDGYDFWIEEKRSEFEKRGFTGEKLKEKAAEEWEDVEDKTPWEQKAQDYNQQQ